MCRYITQDVLSPDFGDIIIIVLMESRVGRDSNIRDRNNTDWKKNKHLTNKTRRLVFKIALITSGKIGICTQKRCQGREKAGKGARKVEGVGEMAQISNRDRVRGRLEWAGQTAGQQCKSCPSLPWPVGTTLCPSSTDEPQKVQGKGFQSTILQMPHICNYFLSSELCP